MCVKSFFIVPRFSGIVHDKSVNYLSLSPMGRKVFSFSIEFVSETL